MAAPAPIQNAHSAPSSKRKLIVVKTALLVFLGLAFGIAYDWAVPRYYKPDRVAGFHSGVLHGALMPTALPTLLMGKNYPIYAPNNEGRPYNIGYILGINACGTLFFGVAFWRPRRR